MPKIATTTARIPTTTATRLKGLSNRLFKKRKINGVRVVENGKQTFTPNWASIEWMIAAIPAKAAKMTSAEIRDILEREI